MHGPSYNGLTVRIVNNAITKPHQAADITLAGDIHINHPDVSNFGRVDSKAEESHIVCCWTIDVQTGNGVTKTVECAGKTVARVTDWLKT